MTDSNLTSSEVLPTPEQWLALHQSFRRYCEVEPWRDLANEDLIVVEDPLGQYTGYCVALGDGDLVYGLGVYLGDMGLSNYLATISDVDDPDGTAMLERQLSLSAMLSDREELEAQERKAMRELGLRYRGRGKWPMFRSARPGYWPWFVNTDEACFLTAALDNVIEITEQARSGKLYLHSHRDSDEFLARVPVGAGWKTEWRRLVVPDLPRAEVVADMERLQFILRSAPRGMAVWELTASYVPAFVQATRDDRPYLPTLVMLIDRGTQLILDCRFLGETPSATEKQERLLELLESGYPLPARIVCDRDSVAEVFAPIAQELGITLDVGPTPTLEELKEDLLESISR